jgi:hypothetical protein
VAIEGATTSGGRPAVAGRVADADGKDADGKEADGKDADGELVFVGGAERDWDAPAGRILYAGVEPNRG